MVHHEFKVDTTEDPVTIIIPCRNEEENIIHCLSSIQNQDFPKNFIKVLLVDDHSTDSTMKKAREFDHEFRMDILELAKENGGKNQGKKAALEYGISQATTDWIMCTDADCELPEKWIRFHRTNLSTNDYSAAAVRLTCEQWTVWTAFQALDVAGFALITGVGIHTRSFFMSNGANHAYRKDIFEKLKGYDKSTASGDDIFLVQKMADHNRNIAFINNDQCIVSTAPERSLQDFLRQRLRWGTKNRKMKSGTMQILMVSSFLMSLAVLISLGVAIGLGGLWTKTALIIAMVKLVADFMLLKSATNFTGQPALLKYFVPAQILHILYISIIGTASLVVNEYMWKGRRVR